MRAILPIAVAVLVCACGTTPKESFYTLNPVAPPAASAAPANARYRVAVGPVKVPEMVDRPQLVVRRGPNRVEVLEQHRWAQSLRTEIARVLAADLESRLREARVVAYSDYAATAADYRVAIDIVRFEASEGQGVTVQADWTVRHDAQVVFSGRSLQPQPVQGGGYDELAAAYGRALAAMSAEIAVALQSLPPATTADE